MVVKCPECGADNPDGYANCSSCRAELGRVAVQAPVPTGSRRCVACGRGLAWDANVCPYCGRDYRFPHPMTLREEPVSTGMKVLLYLVSFLVPLAGFVIGAIYYTKEGEEYKRIGKFCIILAILSVLLSIGMAALLYATVISFARDDIHDTPVSVLMRTTITSGYKFAFLPLSADASWSEVTIILSDGSYAAQWNPATGQLVGDYIEVSELGYRMLGDMAVWCNVTDLAGNGAVNNGDYFTLTTSSFGFESGTTYTVTVMYEPTDGSICHSTFTG